YASAGELYKLFSTSGAKTGGAAGAGGGAAGAGGRHSVGSARGSGIVDERTKSSIPPGKAAPLQEVRQVIAQLQISLPQVLIESRIVTASTNYDQELGIRWGGASIANSNGTTIKTGGSLNTLNELQNIITTGGGTGTVTSPDDLVVDLGVDAATSSFGI